MNAVVPGGQGVLYPPTLPRVSPAQCSLSRCSGSRVLVAGADGVLGMLCDAAGGLKDGARLAADGAAGAELAGYAARDSLRPLLAGRSAGGVCRGVKRGASGARGAAVGGTRLV